MLTETTVSKLREMRLSVMANALKDQFADPQFQSMAFEDRLGLLVDAEWNARKNNHLNKLIRQATFSDPGACLENVEYLPDRGLKQEELLRFGTCNYIQEPVSYTHLFLYNRQDFVCDPADCAIRNINIV